MTFGIRRPTKIESVYFNHASLGAKLLTIEVEEDSADAPYVDKNSKPGWHVYRFLGDFERPIDAADRSQTDQPLPSPRVDDGDTLWQLLKADFEAVWGLSLTEAKAWWQRPSAAFFGDTPAEHATHVAGFGRIVTYLRSRTIEQLRAQTDQVWAIHPDPAGAPGIVEVETADEFFRARVLGSLVIPIEIYHPGMRVFGTEEKLVEWLHKPEAELNNTRPVTLLFHPDLQDSVVVHVEGLLIDILRENTEEGKDVEAT